MLSVLMTLMVSALAFAQADVAGNWRVEFVVPTGEMATNMTINQKGTTLTGRVVNEDGEFPLEGKIVDDQITVEWTVPEQGQPMKDRRARQGPRRRDRRDRAPWQRRRRVAVCASIEP